MPRPTKQVPPAVQRRLGIRLEQGRWCGREGWWLHYGHELGSEWQEDRDEALRALERYIKKRIRGWAKDLEALLKLQRWTEDSLADYNDGEEG